MTIAALAGRRIDPANAATPRFPASQIETVGRRIGAALASQRVGTIVCAAACGADLVALAAAERAGIRRRIVLPYAAPLFRSRSVVDRPGDWGPLFDRFVEEAQRAGDLVILGLEADSSAYERTNTAILDEAQALATSVPGATAAFVVWDGPIAGRVDYTSHFALAAEQRGIPVHSIGILTGTG